MNKTLGSLARQVIHHQHAVRTIATTQNLCVGRHWRIKNGLSPTGFEYGPLTDIPDWSHADGRPAPLTIRQKLRREEKTKMAKTVFNMVTEMKEAKNKLKNEKEEIEKTKQKLKARKLRPRKR